WLQRDTDGTPREATSVPPAPPRRPVRDSRDRFGKEDSGRSTTEGVTSGTEGPTCGPTGPTRATLPRRSAMSQSRTESQEIRPQGQWWPEGRGDQSLRDMVRGFFSSEANDRML